MEVEFTFWYLYCFFLLLAEIARLQVSVFHATVIGQASVTIYVISLASVISMAWVPGGGGEEGDRQL